MVTKWTKRIPLPGIFFNLNSVSHLFLSSYQHIPLAKLRTGTINELNSICQLPTSFRSLKYRPIIITSVMLTRKLYDVLSQINNDHPQISVSKETGQTQFQQLPIMFCADVLQNALLLRHHAGGNENKISVFENANNIVTCSYSQSKRLEDFSTDTLSMREQYTTTLSRESCALQSLQFESYQVPPWHRRGLDQGKHVLICCISSHLHFFEENN